MFARVGIFHGAPERVDDDETHRAREQMFSTLLRLSGFAGLYVLADRHTGKSIGISLWETEAALQAWEQMRRPMVADRAAAAGHTEQEGSSYEVVFNSLTSPMSTAPVPGTSH